MNRLWVWFSAAIGLVVILVAISPIAYRYLFPPEPMAFHEMISPPLDEPELQEFQRRVETRTLTQLARNLVIGALVGLVVGVILTRWIVAPLRKLDEGAQAVARGQLDIHLPVEGSREMRSVSESFNYMTDQLQRQEKLRKNLLADVTHELRHPVHILQGGLRAILDGVYPLNMQEVERLLEQTQHLTHMVDDLHELAMAEAEELSMSKQKTDLVRLVIQTTEAFQTLTFDQGIYLTTETPVEALFCLVDAARIRQALQNLIGNALRYTPQGGHIKIILTQTEPDQVRIAVKDSGVGIDPEHLEHIFDRFYRPDISRNRQIPGAGLGLSIAQAIVQAHGGRILAESEGTGKGSLFVICLPLEKLVYQRS